MKREIGDMERKFLAWVQLRGQKVVRTGDMIEPLGITPEQEANLLSRLARSRMIARVRRGLYVVPPRLPLGGIWSPSPALAIDTLIKDKDGAYQICGPNAFSRYGYTEQMPTRIYAYNNKLSGDRTIGSVALVLIKISTERLGGVEKYNDPEGIEVIYSSRARTLIDAVYDWSRFGSLPKAYDWIRNDVEAGNAAVEEITKMAIRFGNQATLRRVGFLFERMGVAEQTLKKLEKKLTSDKSIIPWIPGRPMRGKKSARWGVAINDQ